MQNSAEKKKTMNTKKLAVLSMLTAMAYIAVFVLRVPMLPAAPFLKYEPKDVIITISGFMFGPVAALAVTAVVSLVEMVTISTTGPIGALMNIISSAAFSCSAAIIYKRLHSIKGAVLGLAEGTLMMTVLMLAWNYIVTPIYMGTSREAVAAMLLTVFLPFNLLKAVLNSAITMLIYKPLSNVLKKTRLLPENPEAESGGIKKYAFVYVIALFVVATCIAVIIFFNK